jgi:hypothetical protein
MSKQEVQNIVGKAVLDSSFRKSLLENPEGLLSEYDLTDEERQALSGLDSEKLEVFSESLDDRLTKGFSNVGG